MKNVWGMKCRVVRGGHGAPGRSAQDPWRQKTAGQAPRPAEGTPQARSLNKAAQQEQISHHERQRAGMIPFFKLAPARRMGEAGKH